MFQLMIFLVLHVQNIALMSYNNSTGLLYASDTRSVGIILDRNDNSIEFIYE